MTQIVGLIIATLIGVAYQVWKRYYSKDAKIRKLEIELESIRKQMYEALRDGHTGKYDFLRDVRGGLLKELRDLRRR